MRIIGCDIGKASAKLVLGRVDGQGSFVLERRDTLFHEGDPHGVLGAWYLEHGAADCDALAATGLYGDELGEPAVAGLPERACLEAALGVVAPPGPLNLVSIGARGYAALARADNGRVRYLESDKCSSGTGETMMKLAGRFGLTIQEADARALGASEAVVITARCSVFAKSEMTHFGNQGKPADQLFRGYFRSIALYTSALLERVRVDGPVWFVGGGSQLGALVAAMGEVAGVAVEVPEHAMDLWAIGAMLLGGEQARAERLGRLPSDPRRLIARQERRARVLAPAREHRGRVTRLAPPAAARAPEPCILGLDLGSTGSKAVLTGVDSGEPRGSYYERTNGHPIDAAQRLIRAVLAADPDVRAVGLTGSGREAVATVLRAALGDERVVVLNEIVAHATAATRCDPDGGRSLSVIEIGGQDAKFIHVAGGQIVESDMNKACSAGTGSFLEEQAAFYGVHDIDDFVRLAAEGERPPDLGQMCTVFVAEAAAEAHRQGFEVPDLFAGFQYSVIHNYVNRVMGQRQLGERVFFQGKPASGESLAWTLAAVTGRDVMVPADPGAMGAWGIGLCARAEIGVASLLERSRLDLARALEASVEHTTEIQCRDKGCATYCRIAKTEVRLGSERRTVLSGGSCPKFEISSAARPKLPKDAPSAFDEWRRELGPWLADDGGNGPAVAVPMVGALYGAVPWMVTFLRGVGLAPRVLTADKGSLARGEQLCRSFDACSPVKIAHGVVDEPVARLFLPKLLSLGDHPDGGATCPLEQGLPDMLREALAARGRNVHIVSPTLHLGAPSAAELRGAVRNLGGDAGRVERAIAEADAALADLRRRLVAIGRKSLGFARERGLRTVVICGSLHVIHEAAVNASIPDIQREAGVLALPMDTFPLLGGPRLGRVGWSEANRALRVAIAARRRGDVYPLMLTAFGCGPASFVEQLFAAAMEGYPHTVLETDGHGGTAGYVTRVQAFLHTVQKHGAEPSAPSAKRLAMLEPAPQQPLATERASRLVMFPVGDRIAPILAAAHRSEGFDAVAADPADADTLALGRRDCSGKECLPYQLIWGSFRKHLEQAEPDKRTLLMQVAGDGKCRNCMFPIKDRLSLERMGLEQRVASRVYRSEDGPGPGLVAKVWTGITLWDLLTQLTAYHRPLESRDGEVDALYRDGCDAIEELVGRPLGEGWRAALGAKRQLDGALALCDSLSASFGSLRRRARGRDRLRTVLLSGDIYVRLDAFANDDLVRRLGRRDLLVIQEPVWLLGEYMASERLGELFGLPTTLLANTMVRETMRVIRRAIYSRARALHPWLPVHETADVLAAASALIDRHPQGEAPVTVGSVLAHWQARQCDGVVIASPWGCAPALVSESLLKTRDDIPLLFLYADGSPLDERRLADFTFRLRRAPRRCILPLDLLAGQPAAHADLAGRD